jgi:hypothetical protein
MNIFLMGRFGIPKMVEQEALLVQSADCQKYFGTRQEHSGGKEMNNEDKKLVAEYMKWEVCLCAKCSDGSSRAVIDDVRDVYFDLNDAGLVVKEMVRRGEWEDFVAFVEETTENRFITWSQLIAWLFNEPTNT